MEIFIFFNQGFMIWFDMQVQDCKFFKWEKDVEYSCEISACLEEEKTMLIDKIRKLKAKNEKLKESELF